MKNNPLTEPSTISQINSNSKIMIVGTSGAGKSTLARQIAKLLQIKDIELDQLFWQPDWTETPLEEFKQKVLNAINTPLNSLKDTTSQLSALATSPLAALTAVTTGPNDQQQSVPTNPPWTGFVIHGNYNKIRDITWKNSEIVIWLDYSKPLIMYRVIKRSILRTLTQEKLFSGNKENFRKSFFSKDSIILWAWNTYEIRKKQYEDFLKNPDYQHIQLIRLKNPSETEKLLQSLTQNIRPT